MQKIFWAFILLSLFLTSCIEMQPLVSTNTPTLVFTAMPIVPTSTPIFMPISTPTLTATISPTSTIAIPQSVKNKQYWAIVSQDRAAFWFMVNPEITELTWYKAPGMFIEYEW